MKIPNVIRMKPFAKVSLCLLVLTFIIPLAACSSAWTTQASQIITMIGPAIQAALAILTLFGTGISPDVMSAVNKWSSEASTALTTVVGPLIDQYNTAEATAKPGILTEIQTALGVISSNLATILPTIHVTDANTQQKIVAIFEAIASEIAALVNLVPVLKGQVTTHDEVKKAIHALKSAPEFQKEFNSLTAEFGQQYTI